MYFRIKNLVSVLALSVVGYSEAFMSSSSSLSVKQLQQKLNNHDIISFRPSAERRHIVTIYATEEEKEQEPAATEEEEEGVVGEEAAEEAVETEEEEEEKEDPEVTKIKDEIAELESSLKNKRRQLRETQDTADKYTKTGYAREVAQMENMRRARSMMQSSDQSYASAEVLKEFLPVVDQLSALSEKFGEDDFGKQYGAIQGAMKGAFNTMGVTDYTVTIGEKLDYGRMKVVSSEHSEAQPVDTVLRPVQMGLELQGNPILLAECVGSLGPEQSEEEVDPEAEAAEEPAAPSVEADPVAEDRDVE